MSVLSSCSSCPGGTSADVGLRRFRGDAGRLSPSVRRHSGESTYSHDDQETMMMILSKSGNNENHFKGDAVSAWMMELVAEEKAARKKEKISNFDLKSIIGAFTDRH